MGEKFYALDPVPPMPLEPDASAPDNEATYIRYALYWAPVPGSPLDQFAQRWFAHASGNAARPNQETDFGLPADLIAAITKSPARYGMHGTLKAPFRLRAPITRATLETRLSEFARTCKPFNVGHLQVRSIGGFLALCPMQHSTELNQLAARCVAAFDSMRAQLSDEDRLRRNPSALAPHQRLLLEHWGYPYVFSEFRFHITLTDRLDDTRRSSVRPALDVALAAKLEHPLQIDAVTLFGDPGQGKPFKILQRYPFAA